MKKYLIIKADTNDADYITSEHEVNDEFLKKLEPILQAIKNCKIKHNWCNSEYKRKGEDIVEVYEGILTEEQIDWFNEYIPSGEDGIHTIKSIKLLEVAKETKLL